MLYGCLLSLLRGWQKLNFQWHIEQLHLSDPPSAHHCSLSWKRWFPFLNVITFLFTVMN